jgi:hypothetical protein
MLLIFHGAFTLWLFNKQRVHNPKTWQNKTIKNHEHKVTFRSFGKKQEEGGRFVERGGWKISARIWPVANNLRERKIAISGYWQQTCRCITVHNYIQYTSTGLSLHYSALECLTRAPLQAWLCIAVHNQCISAEAKSLDHSDIHCKKKLLRLETKRHKKPALQTIFLNVKAAIRWKSWPVGS